MLALLAVLTGLLAGCAGEDLSKANFERTTVKMEPGNGQGTVPTGPIDDPAVALPALRTVDPCPLLTGDALGDLVRTGDPLSFEWGVCSVDARDAGGKTVALRLELGESLVLADQASGNVEGLPLVETKTDDGTCFVTAITSRQPDLGIGLQVEYEGSNPCAPGHRILSSVIRQLRDTPRTYDVERDSLIETDPCASVADGTLAEVLGDEVAAEPTGLHSCQFRVGRAAVYVRFSVGYPPIPEGRTEIDLGGGHMASRKESTTDLAECNVSWQHRAVSDEEGEQVSVDYSDYGEDATQKQACSKVTDVARSVVTTLPSA